MQCVDNRKTILWCTALSRCYLLSLKATLTKDDAGGFNRVEAASKYLQLKRIGTFTNIFILTAVRMIFI